MVGGLESCLYWFSKSGLNGGDDTNIVLMLQNTDTTSVIMISIDRLLALQETSEYWRLRRPRREGMRRVLEK